MKAAVFLHFVLSVLSVVKSLTRSLVSLPGKFTLPNLHIAGPARDGILQYCE